MSSPTEGVELRRVQPPTIASTQTALPPVRSYANLPQPSGDEELPLVTEPVDPERGEAKADAAAAAEAAARDRDRADHSINWLCINCDTFSPPIQLTLLSFGVFLFFMLCSYVEEYLFKLLPDFEYGWYMTVFELTCFSTFAALERGFRGQQVLHHRASLFRHFAVAVAMTASRGLTNVSLQHLNYPTQLIFKSMKLITVMLGSVIILRKSYAWLEYTAAFLLVASAALFSLGDISVTPSYSYTGIVIVLVSLIADALHSNTQESVLKDAKAPESEVMLFTNMFATLCTLLVCILTGELWEAFNYCATAPAAYFIFVFRACVIYLGVLCFVTTIKHFGVVTATAVTTVRKILSIVVSFLMFPKPFSLKYLYGFLFFCISVGLSFYHTKQQKQKRPAN